MKHRFYILIIIFSIISCNEDEKDVEKIEFKTDYKFSSVIENELAKDTVAWKYQISAADYAIKGDYKNALIHWDSAMGTKQKSFTETQVDSINQKYSKIKAIDYIVDQAKKNQVIIINEAHHNSFHRVFTKSLLQKLFENGYKNLGLEALSNGADLDSTLNIRKYPILKSGYYTKDPQFGDLVRTALEIGYTVFPYETEDFGNSTTKSREIDQAKNIQNIIESNPNEKFLIHCGYDHNLEGTHPSWGNTMASRLTEYTGINPLTINQVKYAEKSNSKFNDPLFKALNIQESSVIINKDNTPLKYERESAWNDIVVFHPITKYVNNRPDWIFENGNKNVSINLTDIPIEFPILVLAFKKGENINSAVPLDIQELENKTDNCNLGLRKGVYEIVVTNGKESYKFEKEVT